MRAAIGTVGRSAFRERDMRYKQTNDKQKDKRERVIANNACRTNETKKKMKYNVK